MVLYYPGLEQLSCKQCQTWIYDIKTGEQLKRGGNPQKRKPHQPTPCESCPRKNPKNERYTRLWPCNDTTFMLYLAVKGGAQLSSREAEDPIVRRNFAILQIIYDNLVQRNADELTTTLVNSGVIGNH